MDPNMAPNVCCPLRLKITFRLDMHSEAACGIPDSAVADVMMWVKSKEGRPVVVFRFCPWCGKPWKVLGQTQEDPRQVESGEEWKQDAEDAEGA